MKRVDIALVSFIGCRKADTPYLRHFGDGEKDDNSGINNYVAVKAMRMMNTAARTSSQHE